MSNKHSDILATFTFLATFLVVMSHADDAICGQSLVISILGGSFSNAHVYNFFWLSGYFLGRHLEEHHWWQSAIVKRISTLVVPYCLWCMIFLVIHVVSGLPHATGWKGFDQLFGVMLGSEPECGVMWYIKTLCLFILVSPLFVWLLKKCRSLPSRIALMLGCIGVYVVLKVLGISDANYKVLANGGFRLLGFLFFCGGLWLSRLDLKRSWREPINAHPKLIAFSALFVWTMSAVWAHFHPLCYEVNIFVSSVCLFVIACAVKRLPAVLTRNAFFIYGSHMVMQRYLGLHAFPNWGNGAFPIFMYVGLTIGVTALAIGISEITRRVVPSFYAPLVGGRI